MVARGERLGFIKRVFLEERIFGSLIGCDRGNDFGLRHLYLLSGCWYSDLHQCLLVGNDKVAKRLHQMSIRGRKSGRATEMCGLVMGFGPVGSAGVVLFTFVVLWEETERGIKG